VYVVFSAIGYLLLQRISTDKQIFDRKAELRLHGIILKILATSQGPGGGTAVVV
jgi:hypothetical protein